MLKIENMTNKNENKVANQITITDTDNNVSYFKSYDQIIAKKDNATGAVELNKEYWDFSKTTGTYRNAFLGEDKKQTQAKVDSGEYKLVKDLQIDTSPRKQEYDDIKKMVSEMVSKLSPDEIKSLMAQDQKQEPTKMKI